MAPEHPELRGVSEKRSQRQEWPRAQGPGAGLRVGLQSLITWSWSGRKTGKEEEGKTMDDEGVV